ncbi:MAG: alpha/beta hydrolase [Vicinamibacterales bacterium]
MSTAQPVSLSSGVPVTFTFEGCRLVGSLHHPERAVPYRPAVVLFNQGPVDRGGAHRLYIKLTAHLTALGFTVFRFDARGIGESEGLFTGELTPPLSVPDAYGLIQRGAWVPDARAAIAYLNTTHRIDKVILGGLCGGAVTAFLTGSDHPAVVGMFGIGTPLTFTASTMRVADLPEAVIQRDTIGYLKKLVNPSAWGRFLSFQTDYKTLVKVFATQIQRRLGRTTVADPAAETDDKVNLPLIRSLNEAGTRGKRVLLVYSENDYLWQEYTEESWRFQKTGRLPFDLSTIADANHTLTEQPWQDALFTTLRAWITPAASDEVRRRRSA